jgi:hypothetical protein
VHSFYVVFFIKKRSVVAGRTEDPGTVTSPQDDETKGAEKSLKKGPEVHEAGVAIVQRMIL